MLGGKRILVVDDEPVVCDVLCAALRNYGVSCYGATDAQDALAQLTAVRYDVMICDIVMPGIGGLELLEKAQVVAPECKAIMITGCRDSEHLAHSLHLGAFDFVQKPFEISKMLDIVRRACSSPSECLQKRAAQALEMQSRQRQISLESVQALVNIVEAKDSYTRRHSDHVTYYSLCISQVINVPGHMLPSIRIASLLHDIGKIGVPDRILTKPGPLTSEEFGSIRMHPILGAEILSNISALQTEASYVQSHHEKWNGKGYPHGISGEQIPLVARIINVADSLDAMLMERSYKPAYPLSKVVEELEEGAGRQFDPQIAYATIEWCRQHSDEVLRPLLDAA
ncbi:MAG: response regulator [Planctomycetes bacterium]|nr:response regulator [Planctomycetota bacterium]